MSTRRTCTARVACVRGTTHCRLTRVCRASRRVSAWVCPRTCGTVGCPIALVAERSFGVNTEDAPRLPPRALGPARSIGCVRGVRSMRPSTGGAQPVQRSRPSGGGPSSRRRTKAGRGLLRYLWGSSKGLRAQSARQGLRAPPLRSRAYRLRLQVFLVGSCRGCCAAVR